MEHKISLSLKTFQYLSIWQAPLETSGLWRKKNITGFILAIARFLTWQAMGRPASNGVNFLLDW